jgi:regulatory protein
MRSNGESPIPGGGPEMGDWGPLDWCANGVSRAEPTGLSEPPHRSGAAVPGREKADAERSRRAEGGSEAHADRGSPGISDTRMRLPASGQGVGEPQDPVDQARAICLRLLTGSARTRKQLADALRKRGIPEEAAEDVLSRFEEVGLIDDAAFAGAWVESRHSGRGLARRALARELRTRGVSSAVVEEAVGRLDPEQEAGTARDLVDRKLRATRGLDRQVRIRRLAGMLARRGYAEGLALRVVREALADEGEDAEELDQWLADN